MPLVYQSGEDIKLGDLVLYHGEQGEIEFVADPLLDPQDWYVTEFGGGVMVREPKVFGSVFVSNPADSQYLIFQARATFVH